MKNLMYRLLSHDAAGLLIAAVAAALIALLTSLLPARAHPAGYVLAWGVGGILAALSLRALWIRAGVRRRFPPPGKLVDVGGYLLHVLAEGEARDGVPPVVWFAGGHASGSAIHHLHREFRGITRSILIDRPATGWSHTGPYPRTTARETEEVVRALAAAGERGPFVWAGHSFGGLLVANIARRHPELVHTLVLLDPTPLDTIIYGPKLGALREMRVTAWRAGLWHLFGFDYMKRHNAHVRATQPAYAAVMDAVDRALGPDVVAARVVDQRAAVDFANAAIFSELSPEGAAAAGHDIVVYDGDLEGMRVLLVGPKDDLDVALLPEAKTADEVANRRVMRIIAATRERYLATSSLSQRIVAPAGSGHNFVYTVPDFVVGVMRDVIQGNEQ